MLGGQHPPSGAGDRTAGRTVLESGGPRHGDQRAAADPAGRVRVKAHAAVRTLPPWNVRANLVHIEQPERVALIVFGRYRAGDVAGRMADRAEVERDRVDQIPAWSWAQ